MKRSGPAQPEAGPLQDAVWLYSYADLMTQLLIFSILMITVIGLDKPTAPTETKPAADPLASTVTELQRTVKDTGLSSAVAVDRGGDRVIIRIKSTLLFDEAQATLTGAAKEALSALVEVLGRLDNAIRVEGHTDDVPMKSTQFPSNWELSSARAISVVRYLEEHGLPKERLSVAGYGPFHPMLANDSAEHRAQNRRVEIVVLGKASR